MSEKNSFVVRTELYGPTESLSLEQKGMLFDAMFQYNMGHDVSIDDPVVQMAFAFFKSSFDWNNEKYQSVVEKNRENGRLGGRPKKPTAFSENRPVISEPKKGDTDSDTDIDSEEKNHPSDDMSASSANHAGQPDESEAETGPPDCPHEKIIALYHEALPELARVSVWNDERKKHLRTRWRETWERLRKRGDPHDTESLLAWWEKYFARVKASPFLIGHVLDRNGKAFFADLEWLVRPTNFAKVVDGKYLDRPPHPRAA